MRACRYDRHPLRTIPRTGWTVLPLMLAALLLLGACTNDARIEPTTHGAMTFDGKPIGWEMLTEYAEFRQDVLTVRSNTIQWQLLDAAYEANPVPIPKDYADFQFNRIYKQFAPGGSVADGEKAFKTQYKIGTVIPEARFTSEVMRQPKLEALVLEEQPIPEETIREQFDQTPQDQLFQMFGQGLGMSAPGTITYEQVKNDFRSMILQQLLGQYTQQYLADLVTNAEKEGRLVINRLPGEPTPPPPATDEDSDDETTPLPDSLARAAERLKADREGKTVKGNHPTALAKDVAYTFDGKPVLWSTILDDPIALLGLRRHTTSLASIIAINYAFEKEGMTIDPAIYKGERERMIRAIGGEEQMQTTLNSMGVSNGMFEDQINREVKLRQLLLKAYPIDEKVLRDRYASMSQKQWFEAYQPVLGLESQSEATYGRVRDQLFQDAVNNLISEKKQSYIETLVTLLEDQRVMLLSKDPMAPEPPNKPLDLPQPMLNGLPRLPYAPESVADVLHLPTGDVHIPVSDNPNPDGTVSEGAEGEAAGDGHGH